MNKKGFTLIELLAVIVLLGVLTSFTVVSVMKIRQDSLERLYNDKITYIETGAVEWGNDNLNSLSENCTYIDIATLINSGYISGDNEDKTILINPKVSGENYNAKCACVKYTDIYENKDDVSTTRFQVTAEYSADECGGE